MGRASRACPTSNWRRAGELVGERGEVEKRQVLELFLDMWPSLCNVPPHCPSL